MTTVDISTLQGLSDLLSLLETDTEIILTHTNMPIAKVTALARTHIPRDGRVPDTQTGIWISGDFDQQLPEKFWVNRTL